MLNELHYGLDIGGTKIAIGIYDASWNLLDSWRQPTPASDRDALFGCLQQMVALADERYGCARTLGVGIPGVLHADGTLHAANLPGLKGCQLEAALARLFGQAVPVDNDCRCFARSESAAGGACAEVADAFVAPIGTGAGGGLIINHQVVTGANMAAGEWGHMPLPAPLQVRYQLPLFECGCGATGCMEHYVSGTGLGRLYVLAGGPEQADSHAWLKAYRHRQGPALRAFEMFMELLGAGLATIIKVTGVSRIVVGGGVAMIDEIMAALPAAVARQSIPGLAPCEVVRAIFLDSGGMRGAALLGAEHNALAGQPASDNSTHRGQP